MSANSPIEWTDHTFNPVWGCAKVSPGCDNCYAERDARRFGTPWGVDAPRRTFGEKHWGEPVKWNAAAAAKGQRQRVFCASMADVFDKNWPTGTRERLWALIEATHMLDWLLLTKRIGNARAMLPPNWLGRMPPNVWLGISVVNQEEADRDIPKLLALPALVRFLSCEPLLGPVDLATRDFLRESRDQDGFVHAGLERIDWVIVGGESGPKARPFDVAWARGIVQQCGAAGVPCFVKQVGARPYSARAADFRGYIGAADDETGAAWYCLRDRKGGSMDEWPLDLRVRQFPEPTNG